MKVKFLKVFCLTEEIWRKGNKPVAGEVQGDEGTEVGERTVLNTKCSSFLSWPSDFEGNFERLLKERSRDRSGILQELSSDEEKPRSDKSCK